MRPDTVEKVGNSHYRGSLMWWRILAIDSLMEAALLLLPGTSLKNHEPEMQSSTLNFIHLFVTDHFGNMVKAFNCPHYFKKCMYR